MLIIHLLFLCVSCHASALLVCTFCNDASKDKTHHCMHRKRNKKTVFEKITCKSYQVCGVRTTTVPDGLSLQSYGCFNKTSCGLTKEYRDSIKYLNDNELTKDEKFNKTYSCCNGRNCNSLINKLVCIVCDDMIGNKGLSECSRTKNGLPDFKKYGVLLCDQAEQCYYTRRRLTSRDRWYDSRGCVEKEHICRDIPAKQSYNYYVSCCNGHKCNKEEDKKLLKCYHCFEFSRGYGIEYLRRELSYNESLRKDIFPSCSSSEMIDQCNSNGLDRYCVNKVTRVSLKSDWVYSAGCSVQCSSIQTEFEKQECCKTNGCNRNNKYICYQCSDQSESTLKWCKANNIIHTKCKFNSKCYIRMELGDVKIVYHAGCTSDGKFNYTEEASMSQMTFFCTKSLCNKPDFKLIIKQNNIVTWDHRYLEHGYTLGEVLKRCSLVTSGVAILVFVMYSLLKRNESDDSDDTRDYKSEMLTNKMDAMEYCARDVDKNALSQNNTNSQNQSLANNSSMARTGMSTSKVGSRSRVANILTP